MYSQSSKREETILWISCKLAWHSDSCFYASKPTLDVKQIMLSLDVFKIQLSFLSFLTDSISIRPVHMHCTSVPSFMVELV